MVKLIQRFDKKFVAIGLDGKGQREEIPATSIEEAKSLILGRCGEEPVLLYAIGIIPPEARIHEVISPPFERTPRVQKAMGE